MRIFNVGDKVRIRTLSCKEVFYISGIEVSPLYGRQYRVTKQFSSFFYLLPATALISEEEFQAKKELENNIAKDFQRDVSSLATHSAEKSKYFLALDKNNSLILVEDKPLSLRGFSNKKEAIKAKNQLQTMYAEFLGSLNKR